MNDVEKVPIQYEKPITHKCLTCPHGAFWEGNGSPSRWYCKHPRNPELRDGRGGATLICKGERHSKMECIPRAKEPTWCPLKETKA